MPANSRVYLWKPDNDGKLTLWTTVREWPIQMLQTQQLYLTRLVQLIFFLYNVILRYFGTLVAQLNSYTQNEKKGKIPMVDPAIQIVTCIHIHSMSRSCSESERKWVGWGGDDNSKFSISISWYRKVMKIHCTCRLLTQQSPTLSAVNNPFFDKKKSFPGPGCADLSPWKMKIY